MPQTKIQRRRPRQLGRRRLPTPNSIDTALSRQQWRPEFLSSPRFHFWCLPQKTAKPLARLASRATNVQPSTQATLAPGLDYSSAAACSVPAPLAFYFIWIAKSIVARTDSESRDGGREMKNQATKTARWLLSFAVELLLFCQCTAANPDFLDGAFCTPGARRCGPPRDRPIALVCGYDASKSPVWLEEPCPIGSECADGQCTAAKDTPPCQSQADCTGTQSCVPLLHDNALSNFCVPSQPAAKPAGAPCSVDSDCQSYHCLEQQKGRFCLLACSSENNCASANHCQSLSVTIAGVQGTIASCSPR